MIAHVTHRRPPRRRRPPNGGCRGASRSRRLTHREHLPGECDEVTDGVTETGAEVTAEDVRDDEATRPGDATPPTGRVPEAAPPGTTAAGLPQRSPRGGDGARTVEHIVEDLMVRLAAAEHARDTAERRADALAATLEEARSRPAETFGMRADKVLRMAEHEAAMRRRGAEVEAAQLVDAARDEAARMVDEARAEVDRLRAAGAAARRDSELVADTAASMHAHVSGLRSSVRDEIARLHAMPGAELGRLDAPARASRGADQGERVRRPVGGPAHALRTGETAGPDEVPDAVAADAVADRDEAAALPAVVLPEQRDAEPSPAAAPASSAAGSEGSAQRTS
ncbi:Conjugative transfer protein TrbL [Pseudonocardia sp. Ae505_Ps2]|nr:Conjugative transfer protein TrbL [Pseudonocardia sp. Ae505_Ps2]